jgi:integrase
MNDRMENIKRMVEQNCLGPDDTFEFGCDRCGKCCRNRNDILLNPMDVYRMAKYLKITPKELVGTYCERYQGETSRIVVVHTKEEVDKLLDVLKEENDPMYPMVFVDVYYGFRRSELLGLQWSAIDFDRNTISVEHRVYLDSESGDERNLSISDKLKTRNSRRTLPLIPSVRELLLQMKAQQEYYRKVFKKEYISKYKDMIFVDPIGNLYTPTYVTSHFAVVLKSHNLKKIRFHDLRHTCASLLVAQGVDMKLIQHWLGHANYSTTADIYSHLNANAQDSTAAAIVEALE